MISGFIYSLLGSIPKAPKASWFILLLFFFYLMAPLSFVSEGVSNSTFCGINLDNPMTARSKTQALNHNRGTPFLMCLSRDQECVTCYDVFSVM